MIYIQPLAAANVRWKNKKATKGRRIAIKENENDKLEKYPSRIEKHKSYDSDFFFEVKISTSDPTGFYQLKVTLRTQNQSAQLTVVWSRQHSRANLFYILYFSIDCPNAERFVRAGYPEQNQATVEIESVTSL